MLAPASAGAAVNRSRRTRVGTRSSTMSRSGLQHDVIVSRRPRLSAAVNAQHLSRDEGAHRACEELDDARDLIDGRDAVERTGFYHPLRIDRAGAEEAAGAGIARSDAV